MDRVFETTFRVIFPWRYGRYIKELVRNEGIMMGFIKVKKSFLNQ